MAVGKKLNHSIPPEASKRIQFHLLAAGTQDICDLFTGKEADGVQVIC
jgi:hypothetical protein